MNPGRTLPLFLALVFALACGGEDLPYFSFDVRDPGGTGTDTNVADPGQAIDPGPSGDKGPTLDPGPHQDVVPTDPGLPPECVDSSTCPMGKICVNQRCEPGCRSDRDCPDGTHCKADALPNGFCVECLNDQQCGDGKRCKDGKCLIVCRTSQDCLERPATPHCDPVSETCVQCLGDANCPIGTVCRRNACVPGCASDRDCPEGRHCDPKHGSDGGCFPCVQAAHCQDPQVCVEHMCVVDCAKVQCPSERPICIPETGTCVECLQKTDCPVGRICRSNVCVPGCEVDRDCNPPLRCLTGASGGTCVECFDDNHCTGDQKCVQNVCSDSTCRKDSDCRNGEYCHPTLLGCYPLPAKSCSSDDECALFPGFIDGKCDPLTRTCIDVCLFGLPFCYDTTLFCVDGACYGCRNDGDCPGTRCSPFDKYCVFCKSSSDCVLSSWQCKTDTGSCHECLNSTHCPPGKVCHPDRRRCVDCTTNSDCKNVLLPLCGKDNTCIPQCTNECVRDHRICNAVTGGYLTCGDWDNDPCLEYGNGRTCGLGASCVTQPDGSGKCVCENPCSQNQTACHPTDSTKRQVCQQSSASGCWYWNTVTCATAQVCSNGSCVCSGECTVGNKRCKPGDNKVVQLCENAYAGGCPTWIDYPCQTGKTCQNAQCI